MSDPVPAGGPAHGAPPEPPGGAPPEPPPKAVPTSPDPAGPPTPAPPPTRPVWPWKLFLLGNGLPVVVLASLPLWTGTWNRDRLVAAGAIAFGTTLGLTALNAGVWALLLPFAGPGPFDAALRRNTAAVMRSGWVVLWTTVVIGGLGLALAAVGERRGPVSDGDGVFAARVLLLSALTVSWPIALVAFALSALRNLGRADLPGGSADAAEPPSEFRCGECGYPAAGIDPAGRCPECGRPLPESRRPHAPPEESLTGLRRWGAVLARTWADGDGFFRRLPMWSGHAASRAVLAWSAGVTAAAAAALAAVLAVGFNLILMASRGMRSGDSPAVAWGWLLASVWITAAAGLGAAVLSASTAWNVWLFARMFGPHRVPLAFAGRAAAYLSPTVALAVTAWMTVTLVGFGAAIAAAAFAKPGFSNEPVLFLSAFGLSAATALALEILVFARMRTAAARVRFASE